MDVASEEYSTHPVFGELDRYGEFYEALSMAVFSWVSMGTKAICNIDTYVYSSLQGTVESMKLVLRAGRLNDAYALLRKYYDSIVINIYSNLYLAEHFDLDNYVVAQIDNWLQGKEPLPRYPVMLMYIRRSTKLKAINAVMLGDDRYIRLRKRCDDHLHYNFYYYVMLNDSEVCLPDRLEWLTRLGNDMRDLFILHVGYVMFMNDHYLMSSDYRDALECNTSPEEDSQYWVAPFVQSIFDEVITPSRPEITGIIKTNSMMHLR